MIAKRITAVSTLVILAIVCLLTFANGQSKGNRFPVFNRYYQVTEYMQEVESYFAENLPFAEELKSFSVDLQMKGGQREFNEIFIGNDILVENIGYPDEIQTQKNLEAFLGFADRSRISTNFMLLPTKCAIKQNEVHHDAPLFNQKQFIEQVYNQVLGRATAIDVYPVLFSNLDQYTYYRTDPSLTSLGAYYVYGVLAQRLGLKAKPQEDFSIQHAAHDFLGETYDNSAYKKITPDVISLYRYQKNTRAYTVTHNEDYQYSYPSLYPAQLLDLGQGLNAILGGDTGDVTIRSNAQNDSSLLVVGDKSILPVLPFLAVHYSQIRFINLSGWSKEEIAKINCADYQRLLVAYSVDSFIHQTSPEKVRLLDTEVLAEIAD